MKKIILFAIAVATTTAIFAQKKTTTSATVSFDATTPKDNLPKADNKAVIASLDTKTGTIAFEAAVNNFSFSNPMMQDHFNGDKWMNSAQFPKFTYTGTVEKVSKVKFTKNGTYTVKVKGTLTVKGVAKPANVSAVFTVKDGKVNATSSFTIKLADYGITGQPIDAGKVATEPKITVSADF